MFECYSFTKNHRNRNRHIGVNIKDRQGINIKFVPEVEKFSAFAWNYIIVSFISEMKLVISEKITLNYYFPLPEL